MEPLELLCVLFISPNCVHVCFFQNNTSEIQHGIEIHEVPSVERQIPKNPVRDSSYSITQTASTPI